MMAQLISKSLAVSLCLITLFCFSGTSAQAGTSIQGWVFQDHPANQAAQTAQAAQAAQATGHRNGIYDAIGNDHLLEGVDILLLDTAGQIVDETVSGPSGGYAFQVEPGTYRVAFVWPLDVGANYSVLMPPTFQNAAGSTSYLDSDIQEAPTQMLVDADELTVSTTDEITLTSGKVKNINAGFYCPMGNVLNVVATNTVCCGELVTFEMWTRMLDGSTGVFFTNVVVTNSICGNLDLNDGDIGMPDRLDYVGTSGFGRSEEIWTNYCSAVLTTTTTNVAYDRYDVYLDTGLFILPLGSQTNFSTQIIDVVYAPPVPLAMAEIDPIVISECDGTINPPDNIEFALCNGTVVSVPPTVSGTEPAECGGQQLITYTWSVTGSCDSVSIVTTVLFVVDNTPPAPPQIQNEITLQCGDPIPPAGELIFMDACLGERIGQLEESTFETDCATVIERTWTASDDCENVSSIQQQIMILDQTAPEFDAVPAAKTISCSDEEPLVNLTASDACSEVTYADPVERLLTVNCIGGYLIERTWRAFDTCGNTTIATQLLTLVDTTAPTFDNAPSNLLVDCDDLPVAPIVTGSDNCSSASVSSLQETRIDGDCPDTYRLLRAWSIQDDCGNLANHTQIVDVVDGTAPTWVIPDDFATNVDLPCDSVLADYEPTVLPTAIDGCSEPVIDRSDSSATITGCFEEKTITWTVVDACANQAASLSQVVRRPLALDMSLEIPSVISALEGSTAIITITISNSGESVIDLLVMTNSIGESASIGPLQVGQSVDYIETISEIGEDDSIITFMFATISDDCCDTMKNASVLIDAIPLGEVVGTVWSDENQDGTYTTNEPPVDGISVTLLDEDGNVIDTVLTDENGDYIFENVPPGNYQIVIDATDFTNPNTGDEATDSDIIPSTGSTTIFTVEPGETEDHDAGILPPPAQVVGTAWVDADRDGIQDPDEAIIPNVTVNLIDDTGTIVGTTTTDSDGNYEFPNVLPGNYTVQFDLTTLPADMILTGLDAGDNDLIDSDANPLDGLTIPFTVTPGDIFDFDAGAFVPAASVGNEIWQDLNPDGIRDPFEIPLNVDVTVVLYDAVTGSPISSQLTSDGTYSFTDLEPGDYQILFDINTNDWVFTAANQTTDPEADSDANTNTGFTATFTLLPGQNRTDIDAGVLPFVEESSVLSLTPAIDLNKTVSADGTCPGSDTLDNLIPGTTITYCFEVINTGDADLIDLIVEDASINMTPITIALLSTGERVTVSTTFIAQQDLLNTATVTGTAVDPEGEILPTNSVTTTVTPSTNDTAEITVLVLATLSGQVRLDNDGDGDVADADTAISGVVIILIDASTGQEVSRTTTGPDGSYSFTDIVPGNYFIAEVDPDGYISTGDSGDPADGDTNRIQVELLEGDNATGIDFIDTLPVVIGDTVWLDENANGILDAGEPGFANARLILFAADVESPSITDMNLAIAEVKTQTDGSYSFSALPGEYQVILDLSTISDEFILTAQNAGAEEQDSDANPTTGITRPTAFLFAADSDLNIDVGLRPRPATIGDTVWIDYNSDGIEENENLSTAGVANVEVQLILVDSSGNQTIIDTLLTDDIGQYQFTDVLPGDYMVSLNYDTVPSELLEEDMSTPMMYSFSVLAGDAIDSADFGFVPVATAIELLSFTAQKTDTGTLIKWVTASETDTLGFNIYRSESMEGEAVQVNQSLIFTKNGTAGNAYEVLLPTEAGASYYWLQEIENSLRSLNYGPAIPSDQAVLLSQFNLEESGIYALTHSDTRFTEISVNGSIAQSLVIRGTLYFYVPEAGARVNLVETAAPSRMDVLVTMPNSADTPAELTAENNQLQAETRADHSSYFLNGFDKEPLVLDVTSPMAPIAVSGIIYETSPGEFGLLIGTPGDAKIEANGIIE